MRGCPPYKHIKEKFTSPFEEYTTLQQVQGCIGLISVVFQYYTPLQLPTLNISPSHKNMMMLAQIQIVTKQEYMMIHLFKLQIVTRQEGMMILVQIQIFRALVL